MGSVSTTPMGPVIAHQVGAIVFMGTVRPIAQAGLTGAVCVTGVVFPSDNGRDVAALQRALSEHVYAGDLAAVKEMARLYDLSQRRWEVPRLVADAAIYGHYHIMHILKPFCAERENPFRLGWFRPHCDLLCDLWDLFMKCNNPADSPGAHYFATLVLIRDGYLAPKQGNLLPKWLQLALWDKMGDDHCRHLITMIAACHSSALISSEVDAALQEIIVVDSMKLVIGGLLHQ